MRLNVKMTEDNSFPLASLIPLFPDLRKRATVELFQTDGMTGLLPIAVRAPEPLSALAIFYNEANGAILERRYLIKKTGPTLPPMPGLPPGLQGWSTANSADPNAGGWASFSLPRHTGVVVAISYRGACNTWTSPWSGAPSGVQLATSGKCLEDGLGPTGTPSFANVNEICNQGGAVQVANCYYTTDPDPATPNDEVVQSGLHYIRGFTTPSGVGDTAPQLGEAYMTPGTCTPRRERTARASSQRSRTSAGPGISATFDVERAVVRSVAATGAAPAGAARRSRESAANVEVKYTLVTGTGNNADICDFGNSVRRERHGRNERARRSWPGHDLREQDAIRSRAASPAQEDGRSGQAELRQHQLQRPVRVVLPGQPTRRHASRRTPSSSAIPSRVPSEGTASRPARSAGSSSRQTAAACNSPPAEEGYVGGMEGSQPLGAINCFVLEMGLKGGIATNVNDPGFLFNDGVGSSQLGYLDCTESGPQNIVWELMNGCPSLYGTHSFNYTPLCPSANNLFALPNPGAPWNVDWRPIRCVKTRPTSQGSDLVKGLNGRFFFPTDPNPSPQPPNTCPPQVGTGYVQGSELLGVQQRVGSALRLRGRSVAPNVLRSERRAEGHDLPDHPGVVHRIGTEHLSDNRARSGSTSPATDASAATDPSTWTTRAAIHLRPISICSGGSCGGRVVWGHFINETVLSAGATPSQIACNPGGSSQPCVPVLVE